MAGEGSWSGARSSSRLPASVRRALRTNMTHPKWHAWFILFLATLAPGASAAVSGGDSLSLPPRALRVAWVLDRDALEQAGIRRPSRLAYDQDGNLHVLDSETRRVTKLDPRGRVLY